MNIIKPANLKKGDTIGILATSGPIKQDSLPILTAVDYLKQSGYQTVISNDIYKEDRYLAGEDETRLKDLHDFFKNPHINAIICLRGGYGALRLINRIDYSIIRNNPKIFCGYSDITALSLMFLKRAGLMTYSGPMIMSDFGAAERSNYTMNEFFKAVTSDKYEISANHIIKEGKAEGILWGGNLSTVVSLCGLDFIPDEPFIFFAEDINEPVYKIDKMFRQLLNIEKFRQNISGLCLGDFSNTDNKDWLLKLLIEISEELSIPSSLGFKISHTACKTTIPIGARGMLNGKTLQILK